MAAGTRSSKLSRSRLLSSLAKDPAEFRAWGDLGHVLRSSGDAKGGAIAFLRALRLDPAFSAAAQQLGEILHKVGHLDVAAGFYRHALAGDPAFGPAIANLAICTEELGLQPDAGRGYRRAARLDPGNRTIAMNLIMSKLYDPDATLGEIREAAASFAGRFGAPARTVMPTRDGIPALGFLSGDFRNHAVGHLVLPALERLARLGHRIVCYSTSDREDATTLKFKAVSAWRNVRALSDRELAQQIRADGIDILIDLAGFTAETRLAALDHRPAPLQIAWAGFPATTGLASIDYMIADRHQVPAEAEPFYSEKMLFMPHSYIAFAPPEGPELEPLPALERGFVTFGSFNAAKKLNDRVIAAWAKLMHALPTARLTLKAEAFSLQGCVGRYRAEFDKAGIDPARLTFLGATDRAGHMKAMAGVDIALDPFPYSGGQTTLEVLWSGLPVVTLPGMTMASRHTTGYLTTAGLDELVAADLEDYLAKAISLGSDIPRIAQLRRSMRERLLNSPLCDLDGFAAALHRALTDLFRRRSGPDISAP